MSSQYINPPPNIPFFAYKHYTKTAVRHLIDWAEKEHRDRLIFCAENGWFLELKKLNDEYPPVRVLAELGDFRKIVIQLVKGWDKLTMRERAFIRKAYEVSEFLR